MFLVNHKKRGNRQRVVQGVFAAIILAICFDYGKHWALKRVLEDEIAQSEAFVSAGSLRVSLWPLFQNHLVLKNFHVHASGTPLMVEEARIRQRWGEWSLAHIHAIGVRVAGTASIQEAQGILDTADLRTRVKVSPLILKDVQINLPLLAFSSSEASFDFLYEMSAHQLSLKVDAPKMSFPNGVAFGLTGQGVIYTKAPIRGKMDVKIQNIDKMMKELVAAGVIDASQAGLVTTGSDFLGKLGLHDITLPLKIEDGGVSLGPISLFKVGKTEMQN